MKQFGEGSLRKLAMDAPAESIFHFEGEDYKEKRKVRRVGEAFPLYTVKMASNNVENVDVFLSFCLSDCGGNLNFSPLLFRGLLQVFSNWSSK